MIRRFETDVLALNMARGRPVTDTGTARLASPDAARGIGEDDMGMTLRRLAEMTSEAMSAYASVAVAWGYANAFRMDGCDRERAMGRAMTLMGERDRDVLERTARLYLEESPRGDFERTVRLTVAEAVLERHTRREMTT